MRGFRSSERTKHSRTTTCSSHAKSKGKWSEEMHRRLAVGEDDVVGDDNDDDDG